MTYHLKRTLDKSLNKVYIFTFVTNLNKLVAELSQKGLVSSSNGRYFCKSCRTGCLQSIGKFLSFFVMI